RDQRGHEARLSRSPRSDRICQNQGPRSARCLDGPGSAAGDLRLCRHGFRDCRCQAPLQNGHQGTTRNRILKIRGRRSEVKGQKSEVIKEKLCCRYWLITRKVIWGWRSRSTANHFRTAWWTM